MAVYYAKQYNDAYVVVDCTGGQGDAAILTMINLGYKNLHYDDASQKRIQCRIYQMRKVDM